MSARTLLIVDDHPAFRSAARRLLGGRGYDVVGEAVDARSAVEAVRALRPDVVLLDVQLPDRDGVSVAETISGGSDPPAVVLTSSRDRDDYGSRVRSAPCRGFVAKRHLSPAILDAVLGLER